MQAAAFTLIETLGKNPYKLEPGISHQNVALKILEEEGFGDDFVRRAQQVV